MNRQAGSIYDKEGLAPTLKTPSGGGSEPHILVDKAPSNDIKVIGNYSPSNYSASRVVSADGIAPTVMENHGTVTGVMVNPNLRGGNQVKAIDAIYNNRPARITDNTPTLRADRQGVAILKTERNEYGKQIRKAYEAGEISTSRNSIRQYATRTDGITNTLTTVEKDNLLLIRHETDTNNNETKI